MVVASTPPTASIFALVGSTDFHALRAPQPICSAGNAFRAWAPAESAVNASLGVATPGSETMPAATASRTTAMSTFGETARIPPAAATCATSASSSTVPAPIIAVSPNTVASRQMLSSGSGEFSGTSIIRMPLRMSASPTDTTSPGRMPLSIATIGHSESRALKRAPLLNPSIILLH